VRTGTWDARIARSVVRRDSYRMRALDVDVKVAVDVGAHIGSWSLLVKSLWPGARVLAFEPWPENFAILQRNVAGHDIEATRAAVVGEVVAEHRMAPNRFDQLCNTGGVRLQAEGVDVDVVTIAAVLAEAGEVDVLKLDCEGSEAAILEAAAENGLLRRVRYVVGEFHNCYAVGSRLRIEAALAATHTVEVRSGSKGVTGLFYARPAQG